MNIMNVEIADTGFDPTGTTEFLAPRIVREMGPEDVESMTPGEILQEPLAMNVDGSPMCHSIRLAHDMGIRHKNLLVTIRKYAKDKSLTGLGFKPSRYTDPSGRKVPAYLLDKDAFTFVTLSKRGAAANKFRMKYVQAFNSMQERIDRSGSGVESHLLALRSMADLALKKHQQVKSLTGTVKDLTGTVSTLREDLVEMRRLYEESGRSLQLAGSKDNWHGGPYTVEDLRKRGFISTDDIPRRKPQYFKDKATGKLARHSDILAFVREQVHVNRSSHDNPMIRMDAIREGWCGVFAVHCPDPKKSDKGRRKSPRRTASMPKASKVVHDSEESKVVRPMVFFTPDGLEELVRRWGGRTGRKTSDTVA